MNRRFSAARRGLTLIELVVVIAILAVLAALIIPKLGFLRAQASNAGSAATAAGLANNIETFKASTGKYPTGLDSLLTSAGTVYNKLWTHSGGMFGIGAELEPLTFTNSSDTSSANYLENGGNYFASMAHAFTDASGNKFVFDHDTAATNYSNSTLSTGRPLWVSTGGGNYTIGPVATIKSTATSTLAELGYSNGIVPAGTKLLVFGIGPRTNLQSTVSSIPTHAESTTTNYGRYLAVFAIYADGRGAQLRGVLDSFGNSVDDNVTDYRTTAPQAEAVNSGS